MKVFHITSSLEVGGAQRVRLELLRRLIALDHDPENHILAYFKDGPMREKFENIGVKMINVGNGFFSTYGGYTALKGLRTIIKEFKPDIIHSQLWAANLFARLAAFKTNIPLICDLHSMPEVSGFWRNFVDRFLPIKPNRYVAVSDGIAKAYAEELALPIEQNVKDKIGSVVIIKNGVDANKFRFSFAAREDLRELLELDHNCFVIGAVGRLELVKNFDNLIQAFAEFYKKLRAKNKASSSGNESQARLVIVGDGSQKGELKRLAKVHGVGKKVIICSPEKSIYRFYSLFDSMAISSRSEGLSVALLEGLFSGLKVITTAQLNLHEVVENGKNGTLVPFGDSHAMADAMMQAFEHFDPEFLERPSLAHPDFEISKMTEYYQALYARVLNEQ